VQKERILAALHEGQGALFARPNVVGVGVGYKEKGGLDTGRLALVVLVERKLPREALSPQALVPETVGEIQTDVIEVGRLRALDFLPRRDPSEDKPLGPQADPKYEKHLARIVDISADASSVEAVSGATNAEVGDRRKPGSVGVHFAIPPSETSVLGLKVDPQHHARLRPARPGGSIGHHRITAGTFGAVVYYGQRREPVLLSNNHVLANSTNGRDGRARRGDPILQPGPYDGGQPQDAIAHLLKYIPVETYRPWNLSGAWVGGRETEGDDRIASISEARSRVSGRQNDGRQTVTPNASAKSEEGEAHLLSARVEAAESESVGIRAALRSTVQEEALSSPQFDRGRQYLVPNVSTRNENGEEPAHDEPAADKPTSDKVTSDKVTSDKLISDELASDKPTSGGKAAFGLGRRPLRQNLVDAAIARPVRPELIDATILEVGEVTGVAGATLRQEVLKSGRTTGLTRGRVRALHVTVQVDYGDNRVAIFTEQVVTTAMSQGGDSGSLVLDPDRRAVGLLFAGSDQATIFSPIGAVERLLGVKVIR